MDDIRKAILGARASQVNRIMGSIFNASDVMSEDSAIAKAKKAEDEEEMTAEKPSEEEAEKEENGQKEADGETEETEEEVEREDDEEEKTEKSHIADALSYGNDIKVSKTGKEIKAQVKDIVIPKLNAELEEWKGKADKLLESCGKAPTKTPEPWWTADTEIEVPYKVYKWDETYIPQQRDSVTYETLSAEDAAAKKGNIPENAEQAKARNDYNEAVRMVCNVLVDLKACDVLLLLKDGKEYELTPRQVLTLGFGS